MITSRVCVGSQPTTNHAWGASNKYVVLRVKDHSLVLRNRGQKSQTNCHSYLLLKECPIKLFTVLLKFSTDCGVSQPNWRRFWNCSSLIFFLCRASSSNCLRRLFSTAAWFHRTIKECNILKQSSSLKVCKSSQKNWARSTRESSTSSK